VQRRTEAIFQAAKIILRARARASMRRVTYKKQNEFLALGIIGHVMRARWALQAGSTRMIEDILRFYDLFLTIRSVRLFLTYRETLSRA